MQIDRSHPVVQALIDEWRKAKEAKEKAETPEEKRVFAFQQLKVVTGVHPLVIRLITSSAKPGELALIYHVSLRERHRRESERAQATVFTEFVYSVTVAQLADTVDMALPSYDRREGERTTRTYVHMAEVMMLSSLRQEENPVVRAPQRGVTYKITNLLDEKNTERSTTAPYVCVEESKPTQVVPNPNHPLLRVVWQRELRPLSPTAQSTHFSFERRGGFWRGPRERRVNQGILTIRDMERFLFLFGPEDEEGGKTIEFRILLGTDEVMRWFEQKTSPDDRQMLKDLHKRKT